MKRTLTHIEKEIIKAVNASGLSVNKLAHKAGIAQAILSRFVNGKRGITLATASKLIDALGLELTSKQTKTIVKKKKGR